jgi:regulator of RNase E activity RraA
MAEGPTVHRRPAPLPDGWLDVYRHLPPALLGHVIDEGFVDPVIRPIFPGGIAPGAVIVGTAITARLPDGDLAALVPAVDLLRPGDILVVDHGGRESLACWGELTSLAAKARGCIAVIVDGAVTNVAALAQHGLPTFARGVAAQGARNPADGGAVNVPVHCGGVAVHPGDLVVADEDGIVVVPPPRLDEVATLARPVAERLPLARTWIERGGLLGEIAGLDAAAIQARLAQRG